MAMVWFVCTYYVYYNYFTLVPAHSSLAGNLLLKNFSPLTFTCLCTSNHVVTSFKAVDIESTIFATDTGP